MSTRKATHVDGDVQVENNVVVGGDGRISGGMTVGHNLKVEGWLEARNIRGVNKGVFPTYEALVAKYPVPQDGWYAGVAVTTDGETVFEFYLAQKGRWVDMESTIDSAIEVGTLQRDVEEMKEEVVKIPSLSEAVEAMQEESPSALANTYLSSGKPAIINGVINGQGQWIASGQGFSHCLVVPIIAGETIVVTYSEDVSLIDRSFFKSFDAETKEIVFAEGYSGCVSNNGTYRVVTRVAPDDASFFYTAYNCTKIISITVGGVEVYASTPASRLLQEELHLAALSRQALRTSDLTFSVGSNLADKEKITTGYISSAGSIVNAADWKRIAVDVSNIATGTKLTFGGFYLGRTGYWAFYRDGTASTDKISNGSYADPQGSSRPVTVEVPEGAVTLYITIFREGSSTTPTGWNTPYDELMCAIGETLPSYVPFVQAVSAIQGHPLVGTAAGGGSGGGGSIIADLPLSPDGAGIDVGYAYIDSLTGAVKVKLSQTEQL